MYNENKFKQLKIRAYLRTGVISDQYLPLDAILYYQKVRKELGVQVVSKPNESMIKEFQHIVLPIKKGGNAKESKWYYNCSFAQWSKYRVEKSSFKTKSGDWLKHSDYYSQKKKICIKKGKFKNFLIKLYYRHAEYIDWYCVGNPYEISELLQHCNHIGKNAGDGWGEVAKWEVKEWSEDWSVKDAMGNLMRAVPAYKGDGIDYGLRPSYWNSKHITSCFLPKI